MDASCGCESFTGTSDRPANCATVTYDIVGGFVWQWEWERSRHREVKACVHILAAWLWVMLAARLNEELWREAVKSGPRL